MNRQAQELRRTTQTTSNYPQAVRDTQPERARKSNEKGRRIAPLTQTGSTRSTPTAPPPPPGAGRPQRVIVRLDARHGVATLANAMIIALLNAAAL